jgi:peroxiredoxin
VIATGDALPEVTLVDTAERPVALADLRGRATLLVFLRHLA